VRSLLRLPVRRKITRRIALQFGGLTAVPLALPSSAFGKDNTVAPSERIHLGMIGIGAMGQGHVRCFLGYPEARIVAVCDVDRWRRENAKKVAEATYADVAQRGTYRGCTAYNDLREVLSRDDVDAVAVATGDNWHAAATVMAAKAGKDVYCEKPISKTIDEARAMVRAVERYGRVFQAGLQQRSSPEFITACDLVRRGAIGKIRTVYVGHPGTNENVNLPGQPAPEGLDWDRWLGPAPWRPYNARFHRCGPPPHVVPWHFCRDFGGGNLASNTVHAFDVVQWALGMDRSGPHEVIPPETGRVPSLTYKYPDGVQLQVTGRLDPATHLVPEGWDPRTRIQNFGALFVGEQGWIHVGRSGYLKSYPAGIVEQAGKPAEPIRTVSNHHQNWLDCIRTREKPACDVETGCRSTTVAHLGCIAHWTGRSLRWDPAAEEFVDDEEVNRLRRRTMRQPWGM